ncbi:MAG TPA: methyl-accepting chemotaxis protein [Limnochordia bacterium]|nr:methyl-accepting chemotaxis protein [Limnochordia bacterium]
MEQVAIIGGGPGGAALLKTLMDSPEVRIVGIADVNPNCPGIRLARQHGIFTTRDFRDLLKVPGKKIIFDATGSAAVAEQLAAAASETTIVVVPEVAKLIWEMVDAREQINSQLVAESDGLLTFIEQGLAHIETLHSEHGQALQAVAQDIDTLSELAAQSQSLVQETEQVVGIIGNVATQTRILGINASIESARAGELGRGFAVVAEAIHKLSASTINSVGSVEEAMEKIQGVLMSIATSVQKVVTEIKEIEAKQALLAQELHAALEEMARSAERLAAMAGNDQKNKQP